MKRFDIQCGLDIAAQGEAGAGVTTAHASRIAMLGRDYRGLRPALAVGVGDRVCMGDVLFTDRRFAQLRVTAPANGSVEAIHFGPKRSLEALVISLHDEQDECETANVGGADAAAVSANLMAAGLWPALRARPYDVTPWPGASADCLFVTAIDTHPLAPDPALVIGQHREAFTAGVDKLKLLTPVTYVCAASAEILDLDLGGATPVQFSGPHPAGLAGTHIHLLAPQATSAWHIGYQDVIAIGQLFLHGRLSFRREISVAGLGAGPARRICTRVGAAVAELAPATDASCLTPGSPLGEARTPLARQFLGRFDNQVWIDPPAPAQTAGLSRIWDWLRMLASPRGAPQTNVRNSVTGMLTVEAFDEVWPLAMPPAPLLRALLCGDSDLARMLGAAMLAPEDLALCAYVCPAKQDYAQALRAAHSAMARAD